MELSTDMPESSFCVPRLSLVPPEHVVGDSVSEIEGMDPSSARDCRRMAFMSEASSMLLILLIIYLNSAWPRQSLMIIFRNYCTSSQAVSIVARGSVLLAKAPEARED